MTAPGRDHVLDRYAKHVNKSLASLARLVAAPVEVAAAGSKVRGGDGQAYLDCGGRFHCSDGTGPFCPNPPITLSQSELVPQYERSRKTFCFLRQREE